MEKLYLFNFRISSKCGSNLLCKLVEKLTHKKVLDIYIHDDAKAGKIIPRPGNNRQNKRFFWGHLLAIPNNMTLLEKNCKCIFILRDPRDHVVSFAYWIKKLQLIPQARLPIDDLEMLLIKDNNFLKSYWGFESPYMTHLNTVTDYYNLFTPWAKHKNVYTTTFEKLVGSNGGGDDAIQEQEIRNIAEHLEIPLIDKRLREIINSLFGDTYTFRKGQIGEWKREFNAEHKKAFKEVAGQLLIDLGYEDDFEW